MRRIATFALILLLAPSLKAHAAALVGKSAPALELRDADGKTARLDAYKGKYVVLEWVNPQCPFVRKHYGSGNMQGLQKKYTEKGVVWLSILSSAPGKEGYMKADEARDWVREQKAAPTRFLLDPKGKVGRAYGAKTTPHIFVIDPKGTLIYNGAIDDKPSTDKADIETARNYLAAALDESMAGEKVATAATQPYGCRVKY